MRRVAVFTALNVEMSPLKALLSRSERVNRTPPIHMGRMEGRKVVLVCSGAGRERSLEAAAFIFSKYGVSGVLSTGFCGGLVPELRPSDVVVSSWVLSGITESCRETKKLLLTDQARLLEKTLNEGGVQSRVGGLVTVPRPVFSQKTRCSLAYRTGAIATEMETFHLGEFFHKRRIPFAGVRVVVDSLEDSVQRLEPIMSGLGRPGLLNLIRYLLSEKGSFFELLGFYRNGRRAQVALRRTVPAVVRVWPGNGS